MERAEIEGQEKESQEAQGRDDDEDDAEQKSKRKKKRAKKTKQHELPSVKLQRMKKHEEEQSTIDCVWKCDESI